jgi:SAM-dependent methyltransferase
MGTGQAVNAALIDPAPTGKEGHRPKKALGGLFVISFISLFWEILLIRWVPCELPFLAFFRSLVLLACFLGMGLGCIAFARLKITNGFLGIFFLLWVLVAMISIRVAGEDLRLRGFGKNSGVYQQTGVAAEVLRPGGSGGNQPPEATPSRPQAREHPVDFTIEFEGTKGQGELVIMGVFVFVTLLFFPVGVIIARYFNELEPLRAYLVNISGALAGSVVFIIISFLRLSPEFWFAIGVLPWVFLLPRQLKFQTGFWMLALAITGFIWNYLDSFKYPVIWSPYQRVSCYFRYTDLSGFPLGMDGRHLVEAPVFVNYDYHQCIMDYSYTRDADPRIVRSVHQELDKLFLRKFDTPSSFYQRYSIPYLVKERPEDVLIIGAGIGNEAAAAVRAGAGHIDAVEIDPGIIEIGSRYHPERPYHHPGVNVICKDARSFLEQSDKQYDLIIKNAVDSHTQFASSAGLRLDSYIMTIEFFQQIRRHLKPDGLFAMEFSGYHWSLPWAQSRIREILWRVFGYDASCPIMLIGKETPPPIEAYDRSVRVSTDDWPQFFLRKPMIPRAYQLLILSVLFVSLTGLAISSPRSLKQVDLHFMLLGAAFMMLEIKSITELSLILGADWLVNSIVITGVLLAIAAANGVILRFKEFPYWLSYLIILVSLVLGAAFHPGLFLGFDFPVRALAGILRVALPVFGAGLVFASSFQRADQPPVALGWNLLGAMIGGLGEFLSLVIGVRSLGLVIIVLYALSFLAMRKVASSR